MRTIVQVLQVLIILMQRRKKKKKKTGMGLFYKRNKRKWMVSPIEII
jgi:hypothetical protein